MYRGMGAWQRFLKAWLLWTVDAWLLRITYLLDDAGLGALPAAATWLL